MSAQIIDGQVLAKSIQEKLGRDVLEITPKLGRAPKLAVVLVGDDPASKVYVRSKTKKARQCGIEVEDFFLPASCTNEALQGQLRTLSASPGLDGILLQLPLPKHLDEFSALLSIDAGKDVDGLHPLNQGLLLRGADALEPCTPKGCLSLIDEACRLLSRNSDLSGLHAVVAGRSILVGKPVAQMLLARHCTVVMCHSRTKALAEECRRADILIAAVGKPEIIRMDFIKPGAIVIDVGINRLADGRLVGDVNFDEAMAVAAAVTPVPGGVGPMTIAMLLANTVESARRKLKS
ncbi:MAG TPA: bifunctional 5,10-methylenetetrahydrofolate dehydrogenase/5,10-methenyltetrahydrofolate cyclohydrolase [Oligoflexia bacterium]|nr:bifunctional 5,10-methylenetetrahydrofolate dehydrogenase/5,10-methenyltetrahydrofolate cyclohydrolase [Oligoflexia bacterium]